MSDTSSVSSSSTTKSTYATTSTYVDTTNPFDDTEALEGSSSYDDQDPVSTEPTGYNPFAEPVAVSDEDLIAQTDEALADDTIYETEENGPIVLDNMSDFEVNFQKPAEGEAAKTTKVYLPLNSEDKHFLKINGVPNTYSVSAKAGIEPDSVILEVKDEKGMVVGTYEVYQMKNNYVQVTSGASLVLDPALQDTDLGNSIYFKTEPAKTVEKTLLDGTTTTLKADDLKNGNIYNYTAGDNTRLNLELPEGATYTVSYEQEADAEASDPNDAPKKTYKVTMNFFDKEGKPLSTVVMNKAKIDLDSIGHPDEENVNTHIKIKNAAIQDPQQISSSEMKLLLGLNTDQEIAEAEGYVFDQEGNNIGKPGELVHRLVKETGKTVIEIMDAYKANINQDIDKTGSLTFTDIETYLSGIKAPTSELIHFLEAIDKEMTEAHKQIYAHVGDPNQEQTNSDPGLAGQNLFAKWASKDMLAAQDRFTERAVVLLKSLSSTPTDVLGTGTTNGHRWYIDDGKSVLIKDGDENDNFQFGKGQWYDMINVNTGDIEVKIASKVDDYRRLEHWDVPFMSSIVKTNLLEDDNYQKFDGKYEGT